MTEKKILEEENNELEKLEQLEKIEKLKAILESKIEQLIVLLGDNYKTINYDFFSIDKKNLDEQLLKIREIFEQKPDEKIEVLVMKKYLIDLTKEFLEKDIFDEIKKEEKKLKTIRYAYIVVLTLMIVVGLFIYSKLFTFANRTNTYLNNKVNISNNILNDKNVTNNTKKIQNNKQLKNENNKNNENNKIITGNVLIGKIEKVKFYKHNLFVGNIKILFHKKNYKIILNNLKKEVETIKKGDIIFLPYEGNIKVSKGIKFIGKVNIKGKINNISLLGDIVKGDFKEKDNSNHKTNNKKSINK